MKTLQQQAYDLVIALASPDANVKALKKAAQELAPKLEKKQPAPTSEEIDEFNAFRLRYGKLGIVKGCMVEMKSFTKHKDWRDILPALGFNLDRQIMERQARRDAGEFVPDWPMLTTYLNQRRWEAVYFDLGNKAKTDLPEAYVSWLRAFESKFCPFSEVVAKALTLKECEEWKNKTGIFAGLDRSLSPEAQKQLFYDMHQRYFTMPGARNGYQNVGEYFSLVIKKELVR